MNKENDQDCSIVLYEQQTAGRQMCVGRQPPSISFL